MKKASIADIGTQPRVKCFPDTIDASVSKDTANFQRSCSNTLLAQEIIEINGSVLRADIRFSTVHVMLLTIDNAKFASVTADDAKAIARKPRS